MSLAPSDVFNRFDIEFDAGEDPVFHGGELITGALKVQLKQQITINAIRIQFKGRACWLGDASKNAEVEKVYFDKDFVLLERPPGRPEPGHFPWAANFTYSLPFQCPLPKGCPTSYEGPQAFVRYFARATFVTDEIEPTQYIVKKGITLVAPPELHQLLPPTSEPVHVEEVTTYGSCCCRGKIVARLDLPKTAYAPGENVIGTFSVNNKQPKQVVDQLEIRLVDTVSRSDVHAAGDEAKKGKPTLHGRTLLLRKITPEDIVKEKGQVTLRNINLLTIPPVPPTTQQPVPSPVHTPEVHLEPDARLLESPSTATLKFRKQPFLQIGYLLQVSLGNRALIEVPLNIHPIPLYEHGVDFQPFVGGIQNFHEADETDKKPLSAPFKYQPKYPVYTTSPAPTVSITGEPEHRLSVTANGDVELSRSVEVSELPNGDKVILSKEEIVIVHNEERPSVSPQPAHSPVQPTEPAKETEEEEPIATTPAPEEPESTQHTEENTQLETQPEPAADPELDSESMVVHEDTSGVEVVSNGNGPVKTVTTEDYSDGDTEVHKTIESYEYTDENGVRVEVQKTTESTIVHHEETASS